MAQTSNVNSESVEQPKTAQDIQMELYDNLNEENWTRFTQEDYPFLKQKIAYAMFGPPSLEGDMENISESLKGYTSRQQDSIGGVYEIVTSCAKFSPNKDILLSVIFVVCMEPPVVGWLQHIKLPKGAWENLEIKTSTVMWTVPVFAVRRCHPVDYKPCREPCRVYIDNEARAYESWDAYLMENKISKCQMLVPKHGMYKTISGMPEFMVVESPAFTLANKVLKVADVGGTVASVGTVGALIVGAPAVIPAALIVGGVTGAYGILRSTFNLKDRVAHKQSINVLTDPEARGCWLNIGIGAVGIGAGAATKLLQEAAAVGNAATKTGLVLQKTVDILRIGNMSLSGIGIFNGVAYCAYKYIKHEETPSKLELFQLSTSILFFGNAVMSNKTAAQIVTETEAKTISDYRSNLRSNRHRKAFDKLSAETNRINGNVIKGIMRIDNRDNFFASIVKMNKEFNKNGVKISFSPDGRALLNGFKAVDPANMYNTGPTNRVEVYSQLNPPSSTPGLKAVAEITPAPSNTSTTAVTSSSLLSNASSVLRQLCPGENLPNATINIGHFIFRISNFEECIPELAILLKNFSAAVYDAVLRLAIRLIEALVDDVSAMYGIMFSNREKIAELLSFIVTFIRSQNLTDSSADKDDGFVSFMKNIFRDGCINEFYFQVILEDFCDWIRSKFQTLEDRKEMMKCTSCTNWTMNITF